MELVWSRYAHTATTDIILTPAHLTATTDLTGLWAGCLSAPARGGAGMVVGVTAGMGVAAGADEGSPADVDSLVAAALRADTGLLVAAVDFMAAPHVERFTGAAGFVGEAASTVAVVADPTVVASTVVAVDTAEAVDMEAVDTGKFLRGLI